ncbi:hypothetical protein [Acidocella aquatica]|uniref:hypothetical protein n=1 Tax=Acidocella aquatica TaxID=1922313 RepID=UPI0024E06B16|nr:hypothetical protein [Acidocella aquatica]
MNSHRFNQENSIWQNGDMRASCECFVGKAGVKPLFQRNQRRRTHEGLPYDDQHTVTGMKQTNQAEMAAIQFAKIRCRDPSEAPLSP